MGLTPPQRRALFGLPLFVAIILIWKLGKHLALGWAPLENWRPDQELAMVAPRLWALLAVVLLARAWWSPDELGWKAVGALQVAVFGGGLLVSYVIGSLTWDSIGIVATWPTDGVVIVLMLVVALHEELAFRGVLYRLLADLGGDAVAVWGTALAFALIHLDNNLSPYLVLLLFLIGLLLGQLRRSTGGFLWLIGIHWAYDCLWWFLRSDADATMVAYGFGLAQLALVLGLVLVHAARYGSLGRTTRGPASAPAVA